MEDKRVILIMACCILLISFGYLFAVTFLPIPSSGLDHAKTVTGFLLGTGISMLLGYYWGSSSGSAAKSETIEKELNLTKPPEPPKP